MALVYEKLSEDEQLVLVDERIHRREKDHFIALMDLAEVEGGPSEQTYGQRAGELEKQIVALRRERRKVRG